MRVFIILLLFSGIVNAKAYKCETKGKTIYQSTPCVTGKTSKTFVSDREKSLSGSGKAQPSMSFDTAIEGLPELTEVIVDKSNDCKIELKVYNKIKQRCSQFLSVYESYEIRKKIVLKNSQDRVLWIDKNNSAAQKLLADMKKVDSNAKYILAYLKAR